LSDEQNDKINRLNFILEAVLTSFIFLSSVLTLTMEKDWWGGVLGPDKHYTKTAMSFDEWMRNGKKMIRPNPAYFYQNLVRLCIVGTSITFFLVMSFIDAF
jgi:hypothetical protein